jgi:hypothetical protein
MDGTSVVSPQRFPTSPTRRLFLTLLGADLHSIMPEEGAEVPASNFFSKSVTFYEAPIMTLSETYALPSPKMPDFCSTHASMINPFSPFPTKCLRFNNFGVALL